MPRKSPPIKVGDRFGDWEVIELLNPIEVRAVCHGCENKTTKTLVRSNLKRGKTLSCGCKKSLNITLSAKMTRVESQRKLIEKNNYTFGYWKVLDFETTSAGTWLVRCTGCGIEQLKASYEIVIGASKSCGCKQGENLLGTIKRGTKEEQEFRAKASLLKKQETNLKKYNSIYASQVEEVKSKIKETFKEKYGGHPFSNPEIRERINNTNLKLFGSLNPSSNVDIRKKIKQAYIKNYGIDHPSKLPSNRNRLKEWCEENPDKLFTSKSEQEILDWVREFYPNARKHKEGGQEIDVLIPELGIGIEYNGLYWHCEPRKGRTYHLKKTLFFKERAIKIIHIWEHHWRDRKEQVKSFLRSALKLNENRLAARKCRVIWSDDKKEIEASNELLDSTHIQGQGHATKWVANVYHEENLIATASFAKHHRNNKDWVLTRFTTKANYTIQGILSKISKLAAKNLQSRIVSWADLALSNGNGYEKAGWQLEQTLPIDYFYFNLRTGEVVSKQSRQKRAVKTPEGMTEQEHASLDGLIRVWDCGKVRFSFFKKGVRDGL